MSIPLASNFHLATSLPLDSRTVAFDIAARNTIAPVERFDGLLCYLVSTNETWQLQGGILDTNWVRVSSGGSSVISSEVAPSTPAEGTLWIKPSTGAFKIYSSFGGWEDIVYKSELASNTGSLDANGGYF